MQPFTPTTRKKELDRRVGIKLHIAGDGTPNGLTITDSVTGAELWGVQSVIIQLQRGKPPAAIIRVENVEIDAKATVEVVQGQADVFPGKH